MAKKTPTYRDSSKPIQKRVQDLMDRMTLPEKVGQMVGTAPAMREGVETLDDLKNQIKQHEIGAIAPFGHGGAPWVTPQDCVHVANELQKFALNNTRLGIPILMYVDADHGHAYIKGSTVFPHNLGMAATKDANLVRQAAAATAREIAATGGHQNLNPVCGVGREPRWGRVYETFGESPYLCAEMSVAAIRGYQGSDHGEEGRVIATPKHFPAYSEPVRGEDASPVEISEYTLRRVFLPAFKAAIDAGARSIMPAYNDINGYPVHGSRKYLTDLLRGELGFSGFVVSDWNGVYMLHYDHNTARSVDEAVLQTTDAGLDIASVAGAEHVEALVELVRAGEISERRVDETVRRVLRAKFRLGLFEDPFVETDRVQSVLGCDAHRELAKKAVDRSVTLLKNDKNLLPFSTDIDNILVTGPNADNLRHQFGGWSTADEPLPPGTTVLEGIRSTVDNETSVEYEPGSDLTEAIDIPEATSKAKQADVAVVVVGESGYLHEFGRSDTDVGEFPTRSQLTLPSVQRELIQAVHATGTPTVVVLVSGRPLAIEWTAKHVPAILMAYHPGSEGGAGIADILFGNVNPSGTLPISFPRSEGHLPTRFNHRPHPRPIEGDPADDSDRQTEHPDSYDPLFAFGHGLSYSTFEINSIELSNTRVGPEGRLEATVQVANHGCRDGRTAIHLYCRDEFSSRVTPVRELVGIETQHVPAEETIQVTVPISVEDLGVIQTDGRQTTEPGEFTIEAGEVSANFTVVRQLP